MTLGRYRLINLTDEDQLKSRSRSKIFLTATFTLGVGGNLLAFWLISSIYTGLYFAMLGPLIGFTYCVVTPRRIKLSYFRFISKTATKNELSISRLQILAIFASMLTIVALLQLINIEILLNGLILFSMALMSQSVYSLVFISINKKDILEINDDAYDKFENSLDTSQS